MTRAADGAAHALSAAFERVDAVLAERDIVIRERDALLAERAVMADRLSALTSERDARNQTGLAPEPGELAAELREEFAARNAPPAEPADAEASVHGTVRKADRFAFSHELSVQVDGGAAALLDVSTTGAQVRSSAVLRPTRTIRIILPSPDAPLVCRARIVWAQVAPMQPGQPIQYRAGMQFTDVDEAALEKFMARHAARERRPVHGLSMAG